MVASEPRLGTLRSDTGLQSIHWFILGHDYPVQGSEKRDLALLQPQARFVNLTAPVAA